MVNFSLQPSRKSYLQARALATLTFILTRKPHRSTATELSQLGPCVLTGTLATSTKPSGKSRSRKPNKIKQTYSRVLQGGADLKIRALKYSQVPYRIPHSLTPKPATLNPKPETLNPIALLLSPAAAATVSSSSQRGGSQALWSDSLMHFLGFRV